MKKLILLALIGLCFTVRAQQQQYSPHLKLTSNQWKIDTIYSLPDCDSAFLMVNPCKVPVYKDGKIIGYTEKNFHLNNTSAFTNATALKLNGSLKFISIIRPSFKWVTFQFRDVNRWYVDNPEDHNGQYIIHLNRKQFKWLNDSTAVYSPKKQ